ncbi:MAG: hypothetical protein M3R17_19590 [Bacteroidota bacterium]|nr:hypothetical protein [Bacteroidota bacterium]
MKKVLFLLLYMFVLTAIPLVVYSCWPSGKEKIRGRIIEVNPLLQEQMHYDQQSEEDVSKGEHAATALLLCSFASVWITFIVAILKCYNPSGISTVFSIGIWVFTFFYLPLYGLFRSVNFISWGAQMGSYFLGMMIYLFVIFVILALVMIASLILNIIGITKG